MTAIRKKLIHNFISLSVVQGLSIVFPLITFPYLIRVLGVESFGIFTMIQTVMMYFDLVVSFGFGLTAVQAIAAHLHDQTFINKVINSVYFIKGCLLSTLLVVVLLLSFLIPFLHDHLGLILLSMLYLLGNLLFPDWYFQGIQRMRSITFVALLSKVFSLGMILWLVHAPGDVDKAILSISLGNFFSGLIGFLILLRQFRLRTYIPDRSYIRSLFIESSYVFANTVVAPLYISVNIFIVRYFTNPVMVGYYAIAEKIFSALSMFTSIANRTFYPHLSQVFAQSKMQFRKLVRSISGLFLAAFITLALLQFFGAHELIHLVGGKQNITDTPTAVLLLRILSAGLIFAPFVSFYFQLMILQGQKSMAVRNSLIAVICNFILGCLLTYLFGVAGMAVNICLTTFLIAMLNYLSFQRSNNRPSHVL
ncbi:MAG TPA: oligosaccharide flippase family protein [Ferruginibacter sp.]|nr:oligosaccharide flippase family protein [Ferruginibacter sp.]